MAIVNNQVGGPATFRIDGRTLLMKGVKVKRGGSDREHVSASRVIAGWKAGEAEPWQASGTPVLVGWTMDELYEIVNSTIDVDMGNGDVYLLHGAWCAPKPEHDSDEGTAGELTFKAKEGEKL